jgi:hypothetical protein
VHFISPAYFLKKSDTSAIKQSIQPHDRICLHAQAWKSIVEQSKVKFRYGPTFWGNQLNEKSCRNKDCGREIPLYAYDTSEIRSILQTSSDLLVKNGLGKPDCLAVGGWLSNKTILTVAASMGFKTDFSEIPTHLVSSRLEFFPIYNWLKALWPAREALPQPVKIRIGPYEILQAGTNLATIDYLTRQQINALVKSYIRTRKAHSEKSYLNLGFYHETGAIELLKLDNIIADIRKLTFEHNARLAFVSETPPSTIEGTIAWDIDSETEKFLSSQLAH